MRSKKYGGKTGPLGSLSNWFDGIKGWQRFLIILVALLIAIGLAAYAAFQQYMGSVTKKIRGERVKINELSCVDVDGYVNIVLLGVDSRSMKKKALKNANSDAIIIVSMNEKTKDVNLISVFRDTYLKMGDTPTYDKINAAYAYGGVQMSMRSLNQAMDLNIEKYVLFNFKMVSDLVNAVGGIEVNVKDIEVDELNKYTGQTARNIGQDDYKKVKKPGKQTLEGVQAVAYGRIRKGVGDDFRRTSRMRQVIKKVTKKLKKKNLFQLKGIMEMCLDDCKTNLSESDMIGMAQRLGKFKFDSTVGFPLTVKTGMLNGISYVFPGNLEKSVKKLHKKMFEQEDYEPSDSVKEISNTIISQVGEGGIDSKDLGKYADEIQKEQEEKARKEKEKAEREAKEKKKKKNKNKKKSSE